jgi:hypothetical protein
LWDAHDWHGLFWRERAAWNDGRIRVDVFGHALLEHALQPGMLLVGKALVLAPCRNMPECLARAIRAAELLNDPLQLRPLPLSGIPGWHEGNADEAFYATAPCFRPRREGRAYPLPFTVANAEMSDDFASMRFYFAQDEFLSLTAHVGERKRDELRPGEKEQPELRELPNLDDGAPG